jgi:copper chaperone CopZ
MISGMTCNDCAEKVKKILLQVNGILSVNIDRIKGEAGITMHHHVNIEELQTALRGTKFGITEKTLVQDAVSAGAGSWWKTYRPVLLVFIYLTGITALLQFLQGRFDPMQWMNHFMAGFFLVFSFFKLLDLRGFADSYTTYDIVAKRWRPYAYFYAFIELGLGLFYLSGIYPLPVNLITFLVMCLSLAGVLQSVLNNKKIRCACLGAVFNLPMSTITILEDGLMLLMAGFMLLNLLL